MITKDLVKVEAHHNQVDYSYDATFESAPTTDDVIEAFDNDFRRTSRVLGNIEPDKGSYRACVDLVKKTGVPKLGDRESSTICTADGYVMASRVRIYVPGTAGIGQAWGQQ